MGTAVGSIMAVIMTIHMTKTHAGFIDMLVAHARQVGPAHRADREKAGAQLHALAQEQTWDLWRGWLERRHVSPGS